MTLSETAAWLLGTWRIGVLGVALTVAGFGAYGVVEARALSAATDIVSSASLPLGLDGVRIVFVADVHAGPLFGPQRMDELVEQVNALDPDVLILGGDYVGGRMGGAEIFYPRAAGFRARLAKLAVLGNHDNRENPGEAARRLAEAGFSVLENDSVQVSVGDAAFVVAGVEDLEAGDPDPEKAARGIDHSLFSVLVSHNPDVFAERLGETAGDWDLGLAGHTHAGQVTFFGATAGRYRAGWRTEKNMQILVSSGVGAVTVPVRFFARPEIQVITLRGAK